MKPENIQIGRRQFLKTAGGKMLGAAIAAAGFETVAKGTSSNEGPDDLDHYDFVMPRVNYAHQRKEVDRWDVRPGGDANLLRELSAVIRCRVKPIKGVQDWDPQWAAEGQLNAVVTFDEPDKLKKYPFLFMTGENHFTFDENQKKNLKEFILRGGFLLMDDCVVDTGGDFFYQSSYTLLENAFGRGAVKRIPREHEVFHNVYDLGDSGLPHMDYVRPQMPSFPWMIRQPRLPQINSLPVMQGQNHGARGIFIGDRLAVFLSSTDIHCGWCDSHGFTFGRNNYKKAIQMGINIIMYALSH
jgi:hypothetical protein